MGILINHPNWEFIPNVIPIPFDFGEEFPDDLLPYVPVIPLTESESRPAIICVATRDLENEELWMDYRYPLSYRLPDWYVPLLDVFW